MKVNMKSWHYRTASMMDWCVSSNLCIYFWQVAFAAVVWWIFIPVLAICCAIALLALFPAGVGKFLLSLGTDNILTGDKWHDFFWSLGAGYVSIFVIFVCGFCFYYFKEVFWKEKRKSKHKNKSDGILISYVKAKKEKICPIIEFTKGDE